MNKLFQSYRTLRIWARWIFRFGISRARYMIGKDYERKIEFKEPKKKVQNRAAELIKEIQVSASKEGIESLNDSISNSHEELFLCTLGEVKIHPWSKSFLLYQHEKTGNELIYMDQQLDDNVIRKSDFGVDSFLSQNLVGHCIFLSKRIWTNLGGFKSEYPNESFYDLLLRAKKREIEIGHLSFAGFFENELWHCEKEELDIVKKYLEEEDGVEIRTKRNVRLLDYKLVDQPLVSIIIPNKDNVDYLTKCINTIIGLTTYSNYEILVIENNSEDFETFEFYKQIDNYQKVRVIKCITDWNYSYINNYAFSKAKGDYFILLNNDTEVIEPSWIEKMLMYCQREDVGAVGAKLLYPDGTIQHAGVILGIRGVAGHAFHGWNANEMGYMNRLISVQNLSAVTAACLMVSRRVIEEVGGFDEKYKVAFNDVDLCMRIRQKNYLIVYNPEVQLYHYESKSRGSDEVSKEKLARFNSESMRFQRQYYKELADGDPYYNINLRTDNDDFEERK